jgi:hypothetical protein
MTHDEYQDVVHRSQVRLRQLRNEDLFRSQARAARREIEEIETFLFRLHRQRLGVS